MLGFTRTPAQERQYRDAKNTRITDLINTSGLRVESGSEYSGACPLCGGEDRFHVGNIGRGAEWFFCRQCHKERGDVIEFVMWIRSCDFESALTHLGGYVEKVTPQRTTQPKPSQDMSWKERAESIVRGGIEALWGSDSRGRDYLFGRALTSETLRDYKIGFRPYVALPGTRRPDGTFTYPAQPAIILPWYTTDKGLVAIRYRFLEKHTYTGADGQLRRDVKLTAMSGSQFEGAVFGERASDNEARLVMVCEGEINAMSLRQTWVGDAAIWSVGSESSRLPVAKIQSYRYRGVWMDRPEINARFAKESHAHFSQTSERGDANERLRVGTLTPSVTSDIISMIDIHQQNLVQSMQVKKIEAAPESNIIQTWDFPKIYIPPPPPPPRDLYEEMTARGIRCVKPTPPPAPTTVPVTVPVPTTIEDAIAESDRLIQAEVDAIIAEMRQEFITQLVAMWETLSVVAPFPYPRPSDDMDSEDLQDLAARLHRIHESWSSMDIDQFQALRNTEANRQGTLIQWFKEIARRGNPHATYWVEHHKRITATGHMLDLMWERARAYLPDWVEIERKFCDRA